MLLAGVAGCGSDGDQPDGGTLTVPPTSTPSPSWAAEPLPDLCGLVPPDALSTLVPGTTGEFVADEQVEQVTGRCTLDNDQAGADSRLLTVTASTSLTDDRDALRGSLERFCERRGADVEDGTDDVVSCLWAETPGEASGTGVTDRTRVNVDYGTGAAGGVPAAEREAVAQVLDAVVAGL